MRTVFSNASDCVHAFAQRSQDSGRSSNVFFEDNKIYSYGRHYLLAEFETNAKGELAIVINNTGYSNTTSKHIGYVIQGTRQYKQFFWKKCTIKNVSLRIYEIIQYLPRSRKKSVLIAEANNLMASLKEYIDWTGNKNLVKDVRYKNLVRDVKKYINDGLYASYLEDCNKAYAKEQRRKELAEIKRKKEDAEKFLNYEKDYVSLSEDLLRFSKDGEFIETSQRVKVSRIQAYILYRKIVEGKPVHGHTIEGYTVNGLNGVLHIGCHRINVENMHKVGKELLQQFKTIG